MNQLVGSIHGFISHKLLTGCGVIIDGWLYQEMVATHKSNHGSEFAKHMKARPHKPLGQCSRRKDVGKSKVVEVDLVVHMKNLERA